MRRRSVPGALGLLAASSIGHGAAAGVDADDRQGWTIDAPARHGVSAAALEALRHHLARDEPGIRALLLLRHGQPVFEYIRDGLEAHTLHPVHSVTKSVVSTLVGVAIARGRLDTVERTLPTLLAEAAAGGAAPEVARMRLADLLTQRSGFERLGDRQGWYNAYVTRYPHSPVMAVALRRPVQAAPGSRFLYSNLDTHLVSVALGRLLGMPLADFARDALFAPLGIADWSWPALQGQTAGAGNLMLGARDLARLGQLWLQQGRWGGRPLVDAAYMAEATRSIVTDLGPEFPQRGPSRLGYGYLFWTAEGLRPGWKSFYAAGTGGQFVLVVPTHQVVIVALTDPDDWSPDKSSARTAALVRDRVVPAIAD
ncbi:serine hydrolase domain-containing protein [Aquabacterium sp.]|uniref:serine hydrolase domain-containing protein n=1 Tax=Aquabacterium sp. TaxID=1872578 RepID=UPI0037840F26